MNVHNLIKIMIGKVRGVVFGVSAENRVYIGKKCNLKGKKKIILERDVTIRPYTQIWAGGGVL